MEAAAAAATDEDGGATTDGEEDVRSDGGSYGSTEVNKYLDYIEEEEADAAATVDGGGDTIAAAEALRALQIDEASGAAGGRVSGGGRGKEVVVENPYYDCYGGKHTDAEDYYGYEYGSGSGSGSVSRGYGSGYDDRYGSGYTAYISRPGYGYADVYGHGYGFGGYYGEPPYAPPVVYRAPYPAPVPYVCCQYSAPAPARRYGPAYAPPLRRHPLRAGGPPAVAPPRPDHLASSLRY
ncbi:glycine-rich cell wall structural protein 1.8-like [Panicum miliaceum]|uniref:Glycine-rich cell wall structural protein 1.8-like n=1 Tax=Panicum miliaceum TaxID=4540 RepID=A0A3L6QLA3_PANMI|nr:glycine-rich cell wall structural protein 1.8-like [Panicum miliaceum]